MLHQVIIAAIFVHVPPEHYAPFLWSHIGTHEWEDRVPPCGNIREVAHESGEPVTSVNIEHVPCLKIIFARLHQNLWKGMFNKLFTVMFPWCDLVIVRDVLPGQPVVSHLVQLSVLGGGGVQVEEMINPDMCLYHYRLQQTL